MGGVADGAFLASDMVGAGSWCGGLFVWREEVRTERERKCYVRGSAAAVGLVVGVWVLVDRAEGLQWHVGVREESEC
jgi:hypothetical protein